MTTRFSGNTTHGFIGFAAGLVFAFILLVAVAVCVWFFPSFAQIREYERGIVFRFGKYSRTLQPGLFLYFPAFESITPVDMRVRLVDIPPVQILTKDNVGVTIDTIVLAKVSDPKKATVEVKNFEAVISEVVISELRTIVGKINFEELMEKVNMLM